MASSQAISISSYICSCLLLMVPGRCHIRPRAAGLTSIMTSEVTRKVAPFFPGVYSNLTRITAPPRPSQCQMELHLFMSPTYGFLTGTYLAKGYRPDFNNGFRGDSNSGPILAPQHLFECDSNNGLSPGHSNTELQS